MLSHCSMGGGGGGHKNIRDLRREGVYRKQRAGHVKNIRRVFRGCYLLIVVELSYLPLRSHELHRLEGEQHARNRQRITNGIYPTYRLDLTTTRPRGAWPSAIYLSIYSEVYISRAYRIYMYCVCLPNVVRLTLESFLLI